MIPTLVMKFGGASVATPSHFSRLVDIISETRCDYPRIIIVLSAMGNTTDELIALAKEVNPDPPQREYDMLITVGERISIALLAMALARKGLHAVSFTGSQSGIITTTDHANAKIIDVKPKRLEEQLERGNIVIVAGFQGVSTQGEITTLGRGGSDTTAVALGVAFAAERVIFYKDVPGIYSGDPKEDSSAKKFDQLTYSELLSIVKNGSCVLHQRSVELALQNNIILEVKSFLHHRMHGTIICDETAISTKQDPIFEKGAVTC